MMESGRPGTLSWTVFRGSGVEVLDCFEQVGIQERGFQAETYLSVGAGVSGTEDHVQGGRRFVARPLSGCCSRPSKPAPSGRLSQPDAPVITPDALS